MTVTNRMKASRELSAPCRWCGYNGEGYWQAGTHAETCPWYEIGGEPERVAASSDSRDWSTVLHPLEHLLWLAGGMWIGYVIARVNS